MLETFCDDQFGFVRLEITAARLKGDYFFVQAFQDPARGQAIHFDSFIFDRKAGTVTTSLAEKQRKADT